MVIHIYIYILLNITDNTNIKSYKNALINESSNLATCNNRTKDNFNKQTIYYLKGQEKRYRYYTELVNPERIITNKNIKNKNNKISLNDNIKNKLSKWILQIAKKLKESVNITKTIRENLTRN